MQLKATKPTESASWNSGSRRCGSNIAITIICLLAVVVGQGCVAPNPIESIDLSITGLELEFYEPVEPAIPDSSWYRNPTNGLWFRKAEPVR